MAYPTDVLYRFYSTDVLYRLALPTDSTDLLYRRTLPTYSIDGHAGGLSAKFAVLDSGSGISEATKAHYVMHHVMHYVMHHVMHYVTARASAKPPRPHDATRIRV